METYWLNGTKSAYKSVIDQEAFYVNDEEDEERMRIQAPCREISSNPVRRTYRSMINKFPSGNLR